MKLTMPPRHQRLSQALDALVARGVLDDVQAREVSAAVAPLVSDEGQAQDNLRGRLAEVAGYVGGAFVIAASFLFLAQEWDALGRPGRVGVLLATAALTAVVGLLVARSAPGARDASGVGAGAGALARTSDSVRRRLASALLTGASASAAFAAGLLVADPQRSAEPGPVLLGGLVGLALVNAGYRFLPSVLAQAAAVVAVAVAIFSAVDVLDGDGWAAGWGWAVGLSFVVASLAWIGLLVGGWWHEERLALGVSAGLALFGAQIMVASEDGDVTRRVVGYVLTALVAAGSFIGFSQTRAWPLLVVGVVGATVVVPEVLLDATDGSLSGSGLLLVAGLTLLVSSALSLRLHQHAEDLQPPDLAAAPSDEQSPDERGPIG